MSGERLYGSGWPTHKAKARGRTARHRARRRRKQAPERPTDEQQRERNLT